jgi:hypothetical protein
MNQASSAAGTATGEVPIIEEPSQLFAPATSEELAGPKRGLLTRIRLSGLDLRNTWQVIAGAILLPLGVAAIVLGWAGAAHGRVDQQQIPYLISGGILGLAAVIVGAFFFWAHWLYRIYDQADLQHQESMRQQTEMMRYLLETIAHRGDGAGPAVNGSSSGFVATPTGSNFHLRSCPVVANRLDVLRTVSADEAAEMRPCRICEPLGSAAEGAH